jgi:hypothetical protein
VWQEKMFELNYQRKFPSTKLESKNLIEFHKEFRR